MFVTQASERMGGITCRFFFFQAEDGIRDAQESRGLGDVYKRQVKGYLAVADTVRPAVPAALAALRQVGIERTVMLLSLIHI